MNLMNARVIHPPEALSGGTETVLTLEPSEISIIGPYREPLPFGEKAR